jgi:hypothetical protein
MILINCVIITLSICDKTSFQLENRVFAQQICESYTYTTEYAPLGNQHMSFALRIAYLILRDQETRKWIVETINEISSPLRSKDSRRVTSKDLEACFDYLES